MSEHAQAVVTELILRGIVGGLPEEDQKKVQAARTELEELVKKHGEHGQIALMLLSIVAAKEKMVPSLVEKASPEK